MWILISSWRLRVRLVLWKRGNINGRKPHSLYDNAAPSASPIAEKQTVGSRRGVQDQVGVTIRCVKKFGYPGMIGTQ